MENLPLDKEISQVKDPPYSRPFHYPSGGALPEKNCQGLACFVARQLNPERWQAASSQHPRVYCLGKCYMAPARNSWGDDSRVEVHARKAIVLERIAAGGIHSLEEYTMFGGYEVLKKALLLSPEQIMQLVEISGLRERGGGGYFVGKKWQAFFQQQHTEKAVVALTGDVAPGAGVDRFILEEDPHRLIEALLITGYAVGARKGYIELPSEYSQAHFALQKALNEAHQRGFLGCNLFGTDFSFKIELVLAPAGYICRERAARIDSIENLLLETKSLYPSPYHATLFDQSALFSSVETLANVPWIIQNGGVAYKTLGSSKSRGTKVICLNSLFRNPGLYEIEFGLSLRYIVENLGGGLKRGDLKGLIIGGPIAGIIPPDLIDTPFGFEELQAIGASIGHGGMVGFSAQTSIAALIQYVFAFAAYELCPGCTALCRSGIQRIEQIFGQILERGSATLQEQEEWSLFVSTLPNLTETCGLSTGLTEFTQSVLRYYKRELKTYFK
ncbi:MAG: NADH-quinone oxidoreductase subunit D [Chloroflexi bacterium]|nr:NADH-quinone oxidoreductase subunit D [Chloroflexota bacterium]